MASLRARHAGDCALAGRETAAPKPEGEGIDGCTCKPVYSIRGAAGQGYERIGRNHRTAVRALQAREKDEDEGIYRAVENLRFEQWSERWLGQLERPKGRTVNGYKRTVVYANEVFGKKPMRKIAPGDVAALLKSMRDRKLSPSSQAQHLRVLGACFRSAVKHGHMGQNPLDRLPDSERPRSERRESAYFTDEELPRLMAEIPAGEWATLFRFALATGMREGELVALTWGDVNLGEGTIRVRRSFNGGQLGTTKGRVVRTVDLTSETTELLGEWWGASGKPSEDALVFADEETGGYLPFWRFTKTILYPAMRRAGIDREGPSGEERTFHSLRHTYARKVLETGIAISWLSRQLGHSSEAVTDGHYGHWSRAGPQREAARLEGAFRL